MLTLIVATKNRPTLLRAITSAVERLPVSEIIIVPAPNVQIPILNVSADVRILGPTSSLYAAWNCAVKAATGPFVFFLNDDDLLEGPALGPEQLEHGGVVNLRLRLDGGRVRTSVSAFTRGGKIAAIDLFHANRAGNINSYIWPLELLLHVGPFAEALLISGDIEWMQRLIGRDLDVRWLQYPSYVQSRGADRLSRWAGNQQVLIEEADRVLESVERLHGRSSCVAALGRAWVRSMRIRRVMARGS